MITSTREIRLSLALVWPLLAGMFMIMIGNGLQGTLIPLRGEIDGFPIAVIGIIMSLYYCGYIMGWYIIPVMIRSIGHIRVFAAFASLASTTILLVGLFVNPYLWSIMRFLSGFCFVGLFIVAESWLNNIATNKLRAQILSAYLFVIHAGLFGGQFLITLSPIENISLFILVSVFVSLSLLPTTLANKPSPGFEEVEQLPFKKLVKTSPFSVACVAISGFCGAGMLALGPLYAQSIGFSLKNVAWFMALYVMGCAFIPLLTGWVSDKFDRRKVLVLIAISGIGISCAAAVASGMSQTGLLVAVFFFGGTVTSLYSIAAAMMNDRLRPEQMTSAVASLILINGLSSCIAPVLLGVLIDTVGGHSFFATFILCYAALTLFGTYRASKGPDIDIEDQGEFQALTARAGPSVAQIVEED